MPITVKLQAAVLVLLAVAISSHALTLSEIYRMMNHMPRDSVLTPSQAHPDYHRNKHREIIGSFRGQPIYNRQNSGFIDDNGVPVPVLPYAKSEDPEQSWRRG